MQMAGASRPFALRKTANLDTHRLLESRTVGEPFIAPGSFRIATADCPPEQLIAASSRSLFEMIAFEYLTSNSST